MSAKVVMIIATGERAKARTGMMYAVNTAKYEWMDEVKLIFFGPAESLLLEDEDMQELLREFQRQRMTAVACKYLADREGTDAALSELGVEVSYVGEMISQLIRDGYTPMVW